ncbi:hypothetical protein [Maribacter aquivivus]|uniref:hypothetical protein n=1 Tax=Maribacter aquivivus TaxID=228958 RepID=UPI002493FD5B|nr:hypothetical protein [Maribacter aquivivus]
MITRVLQSSLSILFFCCFISIGRAQIKIGDSPSIINNSSLLELESTGKVLVITRVSNEEMMAITPLTGGMVYNSDENCLFYFNGANWVSLCDATNLEEYNETITSLVSNTDGTFTYTNEEGTETILPVNESSLVNNGNGTFTFTIANENPVIFNGAPETTSTLIDNLDGSYTYTNEIGNQTIVSLNGGTLTDNEDGTFSYQDSNDNFIVFNGADETTSTLEDHQDGSYTYTNEEGEETVIDLSNSNNEVSGETGSVFFAGSDGIVSENNDNLYWDNVNNRIGIKNSAPNSTLSVNGSFATKVSFASGSAVGANELQHTIFIDGSGISRLFLPAANTATGRMYIIKKKPEILLTVVASYLDSDSVNRRDVPEGINVLWLQSNGFIWEQVN